MSYRAEVDALLAEERSLELELAEVSKELAATEARKARRKELVAALRKVGRQVAHAQGLEPKQRSLPLLHNVRVASPCKADWDGMTGDGYVRHCGVCDKNVYNLSALTRQDAEALLLRNETDLCVRFYRRADGKIMTSDCGPGRRRRRRRRGVALATALTAGVAGHTAIQPPADSPGCEIDPYLERAIRESAQARLEIMGRVAGWSPPPRPMASTMGAVSAFPPDPTLAELEAERLADEEAAVSASFEALIQRIRAEAQADRRAAAEHARDTLPDDAEAEPSP